MPNRFNGVSLLRIVVLVIVVALRLWLKQDWAGNIVLVGGWILGYLLADADHFFYVTVSNPQEVSSQRVRSEFAGKNWRNAWTMLKATSSERVKLPIHNVLTAIVVALLGLWLVTSNGNLLAVGIVLGLGIKLWSEFVTDAIYGKWYWIFAREFSMRENQVLQLVWGTLLLIQLTILIRG